MKDTDDFAGHYCPFDSPSRCVKGQKGVLCAECDTNFTRFGYKCLECSDPSVKKLLALMTFPFLLIAIMMLLPPVTDMSSRIDIMIEIIDFGQLLFIICSPRNKSAKGNAFQLLTTMSVWSGASFQRLFDRGRCPFNYPASVNDETLGVYIWQIYCLYILLVQGCALFFMKFLYRCKKGGVIRSLHARLRGATFRIYSFTFSILVSTGLSTLQCAQFLDESRAKWHFGTLCSSSFYDAMRILGGLLSIVIGLLAPCLLFFKLSWLEVEHQITLKVIEAQNADADEDVGTVLEELKRVKGNVLYGLAHPKATITRAILGRERRRMTPKQWEDMTLYGVLFLNLEAKNRIWYPGFLFLRRFLFYCIFYILGTTIDVDKKGNIATIGPSGGTADQFILSSVILFMFTVLTLYVQVVKKPYIRPLENAFAIYCTLTLTIIAGLQIVMKRTAYVAEGALSKNVVRESEYVRDKLSEIVYYVLVIYIASVVFMYADFILLSSKSYRRLLKSISTCLKGGDTLHAFEKSSGVLVGPQSSNPAEGLERMQSIMPSYATEEKNIVESDNIIQLALDVMEMDEKKKLRKSEESPHQMNSISLVAATKLKHAEISREEVNTKLASFEEEKISERSLDSMRTDDMAILKGKEVDLGEVLVQDPGSETTAIGAKGTAGNSDADNDVGDEAEESSRDGSEGSCTAKDENASDPISEEIVFESKIKKELKASGSNLKWIY